MTIELFLFILSLFSMISMLSVKTFEIKTGKSIISKVSAPADGVIRKKIHSVRGLLALLNGQNVKHALAVLLHVSQQGYLFLQKKWQEKYAQLSGTVHTRKDFKVNKDPVSFFLKDVLEYKNKLNREH